jgi:hypothetical protein
MTPSSSYLAFRFSSGLLHRLALACLINFRRLVGVFPSPTVLNELFIIVAEFSILLVLILRIFFTALLVLSTD